MNKSFIVLLAATLLVVALPPVAADEAHPDCEDGQPGLSYNGPLAGPTTGVACEGEHWDGQDPISSEGAKDNQPCPVAEGTHVSVCQGPGAGEEESNVLAGKPVTARFSTDGSAAYLALNIDLVGQIILYGDGDMAALYIEDGSALNALAIAVSSLGITKGYVSEADCTQEEYEAGATAAPGEPGYRGCGRDNTAITVILP